MVEARPPQDGDHLVSVHVDQQGKQDARSRSQQSQRPPSPQYDKKYSAMMTAIVQSRYKSRHNRNSGAASSVTNLPKGVVNPFSVRYNIWLMITILAAAGTGWFEVYMMAFNDYPGPYPPKDASSVITYIMYTIFVLDMALHFRVAILQGDRLVTNPREIARIYGRGRFIVDLLSVLPFDFFLLLIMGKATAPQDEAPGVSSLALLRLLRMYRLRYFFDFLAVHPRVSYTLLVIIRNYTIVFYVAHFAGCMLYYIARLQKFSPMTWVMRNSERFNDASDFGKYLYSIYWALTTLTSIGYGDLHPFTVPEVVFVIAYQATIITVFAFLTASITSLVIKTDTFNGRYHEQLKNLLQFSRTNSLPGEMQQSLADHLRLYLASEAASDSSVLAIYPSAVRRKVLRHLYRDEFEGCYLFDSCPKPFLDKLITQAYIEMYMPEVEIVTQGEGVDHLYILVTGTAELTSTIPAELTAARHSPSPVPLPDPDLLPAAAVAASAQPGGVLLMDGSMFGELSFFLQNDSLDTVRTLTVCRVLAVSRRVYEGIKALYPTAARKVLQNLYDAADDAIRKQEAIGLPLAARSTVWAAVTPHGLQRQNSMAPGAADDLSQHGSVPLDSSQRGLQSANRPDQRGGWKKLKQQLKEVGQLLQQYDQQLLRDSGVIANPATATTTAATSTPADAPIGPGPGPAPPAGPY